MTYQPFHIDGQNRDGPWLITCDHATNVVPGTIAGGDLGLGADEMARHIAYDIGALGVAQALGAALDAPVLSSNFSRLVIDPNRGVDDPTLVMKLYDGTIIPANRYADSAERVAREALCYRPYHTAYAELAAREGVAIVSIHSFTPQLRGRPPRPWEIGVLSAQDRRLADPLLAALRAAGDLNIGDNEPYSGHLPGDAIDQHALQHDRLNALIELRNDLITTPEGQLQWATRLAPLLQTARAAL